jgi:hypothetical protein
MRENVQRRKCDNCQRVVENKDVPFGGVPFGGWLKIEIDVGNSFIDSINGPESGPWDFCSMDCAIEYLKEWKQKS